MKDFVYWQTLGCVKLNLSFFGKWQMTNSAVRNENMFWLCQFLVFRSVVFIQEEYDILLYPMVDNEQFLFFHH